MSFKHLKMLNFASKCLKITLIVIKFSKPEKNFRNKLKLMGGYPPMSNSCWGYIPPSPYCMKPWSPFPFFATSDTPEILNLINHFEGRFYLIIDSSIPEIQRNRDFYKSTDVRPPFTYASLIRQVSVLFLWIFFYTLFSEPSDIQSGDLSRF
jgi:hypothetical protein